MIISMRLHAPKHEIDAVCDRIREFNYKIHAIEGEERVVIGAVGVGDVTACLESLEAMPGVEKAVRISAPYKFVSREFRPGRTEIVVRDAVIGGSDFVVMAGPCSVESEKQILESAELVASHGAKFLRGGAFKPRTSPYAFYQYWINVDDADTGKCLRFLTELSHEEIESLDAARTANPGQRESQRRLAEEITRLVHGEDGLATARRATEIFFGAEISELNDQQLSQIFADVPSRELQRDRLSGDGLPLIDASSGYRSIHDLGPSKTSRHLGLFFRCWIGRCSLPRAILRSIAFQISSANCCYLASKPIGKHAWSSFSSDLNCPRS
jgi:hypothetical protein